MSFGSLRSIAMVSVIATTDSVVSSSGIGLLRLSELRNRDRL